MCIRDSFKIITHEILRFTEASQQFILPVDFSSGKKALKNNVKTGRDAKKFLEQDGVIILFPAGELLLLKK